MTTVTYELKISNDDMLNRLRELAKSKNTTEINIIKDIVTRELKRKETQKEKIDRLTMNKNTYNPDSKGFDELIGCIKAPNGFDPVKAVQELREGKY